MAMSALMQFLERTEPGFGKTVQGAEPELIAETQEMAGGRLPTSYLEFLGMMGLSTGSLALTFASFEFTKVSLRNLLDRQEYPAELYLVGLGDNIMGLDYFLDLARSTGNDAPIVKFEMRRTPPPMPFYRSFLGMLGDFAFEQRCITAKAHRLDCFILTETNTDSGRRDVMVRLGALLGRLGFVSVLDIGADGFLLERVDCCASVNCREGGSGLGLELASDNPLPPREALAIVQDHMAEIGGTLRIRKGRS